MKTILRNCFGIPLVCCIAIGCAPVPVYYSVSSSKVVSEGESYDSNNPLLLLVEIKQKHYPNKKVENILRITISNKTAGNIQIDTTNFLTLKTDSNSLDTIQMITLLSKDLKSPLIAGKEYHFNYEYWSTTFSGRFQEFIKTLENEVLEMRMFYRWNGRDFGNYVLLKPSLKKFK